MERGIDGKIVLALSKFGMEKVVPSPQGVYHLPHIHHTKGVDDWYRMGELFVLRFLQDIGVWFAVLMVAFAWLVRTDDDYGWLPFVGAAIGSLLISWLCSVRKHRMKKRVWRVYG